MSDVGFGDILFIVLILGVIHGIMFAVTRMRQRARQARKTETDQTAS